MQFFYYLWYDAIYKRQYTNKTLTLRKSMCMRASVATELREISDFHILKLLFLSIFCWYTSDTLSVQKTSLSAYIYQQISKCTDKTAPPPPPPPPSGYANDNKEHIIFSKRILDANKSILSLGVMFYSLVCMCFVSSPTSNHGATT